MQTFDPPDRLTNSANYYHYHHCYKFFQEKNQKLKSLQEHLASEEEKKQKLFRCLLCCCNNPTIITFPGGFLCMLLKVALTADVCCQSSTLPVVGAAEPAGG